MLDPDVGRALVAYKYRKEFGLTAQQMNDEPYDDVQVIIKIWEYQDQRQKLDEKRAEQKGKSRHR